MEPERPLRGRRRACDACHVRKVKCEGPNCRQCRTLQLTCMFSARPLNAPRKPRKRRGDLISLYRWTPSSLPKLLPNENGNSAQLQEATKKEAQEVVYPVESLFTKEFFSGLVEKYGEVIFPVWPAVTANQLQESIKLIDSDPMHAAFVYSMAAVTISHSGAQTFGFPSSKVVSRLIDMALEARGPIKPNTVITVRSIMTSIGLSSTLVAAHHVEIAWLYLREAITMTYIIGLGNTDSINLSLAERGQRQRLYWILFIHERFMAIHYYRPVILTPLDSMPEMDPDLPTGVQNGFNQIIKLFSLVDGNFLKAYLGEGQPISESWIQEKQQEIHNSESEINTLSEMQQADLIITQQWLRMLVWKMAMSRYLLAEDASAGGGYMSLLFPVEIAKKLRELISRCSIKSIMVHGASIFEKLLELALGVADALLVIPEKSLSHVSGRIDDYNWIADFLLSKESPITRDQKDILQEKVAGVRLLLLRSGDSTRMQLSESNHQTQQLLETQDPWLMLSKSFEIPLSNKDLAGALIPSLADLSETSQGLLSDLDFLS
jgi:Fungal Zn(2)-Cys(6) binuclear cluster domain